MIIHFGFQQKYTKWITKNPFQIKNEKSPTFFFSLSLNHFGSYSIDSIEKKKPRKSFFFKKKKNVEFKKLWKISFHFLNLFFVFSFLFLISTLGWFSNLQFYWCKKKNFFYLLNYYFIFGVKNGFIFWNKFSTNGCFYFLPVEFLFEKKKFQFL